MKTYDVWVTEFAEKSIRKIAKYMAKELMNSEAAISFLNNVSEDIYSLRGMPGRFSLIPDEPWRTNGLRQMIVKQYYVYYWVDEDHGIVHVTDVVSMRRDQLKAIKSMPWV